MEKEEDSNGPQQWPKHNHRVEGVKNVNPKSRGTVRSEKWFRENPDPTWGAIVRQGNSEDTAKRKETREKQRNRNRLSDSELEYGVEYSLNKHKRWELVPKIPQNERDKVLAFHDRPGDDARDAVRVERDIVQSGTCRHWEEYDGSLFESDEEESDSETEKPKKPNARKKKVSKKSTQKNHKNYGPVRDLYAIHLSEPKGDISRVIETPERGRRARQSFNPVVGLKRTERKQSVQSDVRLDYEK